MLCPNCNRDLKENSNKQSFYTKQNKHFGKPFRSFGFVCGHCNFHITMIQIPINSSFIRTNRTYFKLEEMVMEFQNKLKEFYDSREIEQVELFDFENEEMDFEEPEE